MAILATIAIAVTVKVIADNLSRLASKWREALGALASGLVEVGNWLRFAFKKKGH